MEGCAALATRLAATRLFLQFAFAAELTNLVNLFIGTASGANGGSGGNVFPGAAVPHAMVKVHALLVNLMTIFS